MSTTTKEPVRSASDAFRALEQLVLDTANFETAYVSNLAEVDTNGDVINVNFDTSTAQFGNIGDGKIAVETLQSTLADVGIKSEIVPNVKSEHLQEEKPNQLWDNKPALRIQFADNADSAKKLSTAAENYIAGIVERIAKRALLTYKGLVQRPEYGISKEGAGRVAAKVGQKFANLQAQAAAPGPGS